MKKLIRITCVLLCLTSAAAGCGKQADTEHFTAKIVEISEDNILVEPDPEEAVRNSGDLFLFNIGELAEIGAKPGDRVILSYTGEIRETYPAQIEVTDWRLVENTQIGQAQWDLIPMVRFDSILYMDTGVDVTEQVTCGMPDGTIETSVDRTEKPLKDNQSNFGYMGAKIMRGSAQEILVEIDGTYIKFTADEVRNKK